MIRSRAPQKITTAAMAVFALAGCGGTTGKTVGAAATTSSKPLPVSATAWSASTPPPAAPSISSPAPASPAAVAASATSTDSCMPTEDLIERDIVPGQQPTAFTLGNVGFMTGQCKTTVDTLAGTVADKPGFCSQLARAADNPGYNIDAVPATALRKVIAQAGPSC